MCGSVLNNNTDIHIDSIHYQYILGIVSHTVSLLKLSKTNEMSIETVYRQYICNIVSVQ